MITLSCRYLCRDYDNYEQAYNDALKLLKHDSTLEVCLDFCILVNRKVKEVFLYLTANDKGYISFDYKAY